MKGYQAGISDFTGADSVVFGISTDELSRNKEFAESLELQFALLSDIGGEVAQAYGVYIEGMKIANRVTFVVDKEGKIAFVESGAGAMDPVGAASACSSLN